MLFGSNVFFLHTVQLVAWQVQATKPQLNCSPINFESVRFNKVLHADQDLSDLFAGTRAPIGRIRSNDTDSGSKKNRLEMYPLILHSARSR